MTNYEFLITNEGIINYYIKIAQRYINSAFVIQHSAFLLLFILTLITSASAQTTFDPLSIAVGARALGMGKAYVAVAEDGDTIFTNPAGLGEIDTFKAFPDFNHVNSED